MPRGPAGQVPAPPGNNRAPRAGNRKPGSQSPNTNWNTPASRTSAKPAEQIIQVNRTVPHHSGRCLITRTGAVNLTRGQHDYGTSRLVDSDGLAALPNGEPRTRAPAAPTPDSDSDGTYHHEAALNLDPIL
jgi:hypothetical protein